MTLAPISPTPLTSAASALIHTRGRLIFAAALGLLLLAQLLRLGLDLARAPEAPSAQADVRPAADADVLRRFNAFSPIGTEAADAAPFAGYRLFGVTSGGPGEGSAILAVGDGPQVSVVVGESLEDGAVLTAVFFDAAVLSIGGRARRIGFDLPDEAQASSFESVATPAMSPRSTRETERARPPMIGGAAALRGPSAGAQLGGRFASADLRPALRGLRVEGLKVGENVGGLTGLGLQSGDVILSVNGQTLNGVQAVRNLSDRLGASQRVQIRYRRNGRVIERTVGAVQ